MKTNPYGLRQEMFAHFLRLVLMPAAVHAGITVFMGLEAEGSVTMLFAAAMAAAASGSFLCKLRYGPIESSLAASWPSVPAAYWHWHWAVGMPSPGGSAQALVRFMGWPDAPMPAALYGVLLVSAVVGWGFARIDRSNAG